MDLIQLLYCLLASDHSTRLWWSYMNCASLVFLNILYNQSFLVENSKGYVLVYLALRRSSYKSCHHANVHTSWSPLDSLLSILSVHIQILSIQLPQLQYFLSSLLEYLNDKCSSNSLVLKSSWPLILSFPLLCAFTLCSLLVSWDLLMFSVQGHSFHSLIPPM